MYRGRNFLPILTWFRLKIPFMHVLRHTSLTCFQHRKEKGYNYLIIKLNYSFPFVKDSGIHEYAL